MFMRGGHNTLVKPFHNDQPIRKLWENYQEIRLILKKHCELMRAKLPHHMPRNLNKGKSNDSRRLTKFEIFFYKPVADLLKIPALAFIFGN
jgi:hypothetical protein